MPPPFVSAALLSVAAVLAAAPLGFQQSSRPPRDITRQSPPIAAIDVSVRDTQTGEPVRDLKRDEFEVSVGGVKQRLVAAALVRQRIVLGFVDDLHLDFNNTSRLRDLFRRISTELIHDGDRFGIVSSGQSSIAVSLTSDANALSEAIRQIVGSGLKLKEIVGAPTGANGPPEVNYRAHIALTTACEQLLRLEEYRGRRTAMIYVSNGYDVGPLAAAGPVGVPRSHLSFNVSADFAALVAAARRTNVTIYTLDASSIIGNESSPDPPLTQTDWERLRKARQATLRELSEATGGLTIVSAGDLAAALSQIASRSADYYVVEFYTDRGAAPERDTIAVSVTRPGTVVRDTRQQ